MLSFFIAVLCCMTVSGAREPALPIKPPNSVIEYAKNKKNDKIMCGVPAPQYPILSKFSSVWRIVGGKEANRHSLPWQVMISRQKENKVNFDCGGSIISAQWVITAAHCFRFGPPKYIFAGAHVVDEESAEANSRQEREVVETFVHPGYRMDYNNDPDTMYKDYNNDIALLKLDRPLQLNEYVRRVCLPRRRARDRTMCLVSGWGLKDGNIYAMHLQQVYVPLMNWKECVDILGKDDFSKNMICAGVPFEGKDACTGDSGGPMVCQNLKSGQWELHGVVSWGFNCGEEPGAYTDIYKYKSWIRENKRRKKNKPTNSVSSPDVASPPVASPDVASPPVASPDDASPRNANRSITTARPRARAMHSDLTSNGPKVRILVGEQIVLLFVAMAMLSYELYL